MRPDILKAYKTVHTWVGILAALFLFVGFYCGAITMFKGPLAEWAPARIALPPAPGLERSSELVSRVLESHPEARKAYTLHFEVSPANPARMSWTLRDSGADHHAPVRRFGASLDSDGNPVVCELGDSALAELLDTLHRRVGLPLPEDWAMPVTGLISLLYFLALVSGLVLLLPSLLKSLFQLRTEAAMLRRRWLDAHNLIGLFSLPFHLVIALTAVVFALHDEFYAAQEYLLSRKQPSALNTQSPPATAPSTTEALAPATRSLTPLELRDALASQAPGFSVQRVEFLKGPSGSQARVFGSMENQMLRGPDFGIGMLDPSTGRLLRTDYFPGRQPVGLAVVTSFFSLHFGNFGGTPIRWAYVLLGLSGAFLFYTGNRLWIEARRRRNPESGVAAPRTTRLLEGLTTGVCTGCMAGVSATIASAPLLAVGVNHTAWHWGLYFAVFGAALLWAQLRESKRALRELLWLCCLCTLAIPGASLLAQALGKGLGRAVFTNVELTALVAGALFAWLARLTKPEPETGGGKTK